MKTIIHFCPIQVSPQKVYEALSTEAGLVGWWAPQVTIKKEKEPVIHFRFAATGGFFNPIMKVTRQEPGKALEWLCTGGHDNWLNNTFSFHLSAGDGQTNLLFTQGYARELEDAVYGTYNFNWGRSLHSLVQYCETGKGTPWQMA